MRLQMIFLFNLITELNKSGETLIWHLPSKTLSLSTIPVESHLSIRFAVS